MKKFLVSASFAMVFALPPWSHAAPVCFTDSIGSFYRLEVKPACKANSDKTAAINGRVHWGDPNVTCGGVSNVFAVVGTCFGRPADNKVVVGLQFVAEGVGGCRSQIMHLAGASIDTASGYTRTTDSHIDGTVFSFTPASCKDEPAL